MSVVYTHAPRPVGGPVTFTLNGGRLTVDSGRKVQEIRLGAVELVRLTYELRGFGRKAFQTRIRTSDGKVFTFSSLSWRSMVEAENLDHDYGVFARTLFDAVRRANPQARFVGGRPATLWAATTIFGTGALVGMTLFVWRALQAEAAGAALMGALFLAAAVWQLEPMIRLNRPQEFSPDTPPRDLLP